jgi:hypothetical protein
MERRMAVLKNVLLVTAKIIFAIAMLATVGAAIGTFGSFFRSEIAFSDMIPVWGICALSWVCYSVLTKIIETKFKKRARNTENKENKQDENK